MLPSGIPGQPKDRSKLHDRIRVIRLSRGAPIPDQNSTRDAFRDACARFAAGVAIATVCASDGTPQGLTISSFTSVSLQPPLVLVCVDFGCSIHHHFIENEYFAVNLLSEGQEELSIRFSELEDGRFEGIDWYANKTGAPLLRGAL